MQQFIAGNPVAIEVEFENSRGEFITPTSASYSLLDEQYQAIKVDQAFVPTGPAHLLVIDASDNTLPAGTVSGYRQINVKFTDQDGAVYTTTANYVINQTAQVDPGVNGFATFGEIMIHATRMSEVETIMAAAPETVMSALTGAYFNIGRLSINLVVGSRTVHTTRDLSAADLQLLEPVDRSRFIEAQIIEAEYLLGGNPVEQRRRMGLMSESIGEVSQFFRTSMPMTTPVCSDCYRVLSRYIRRGVTIGRA